MIYFNLILHLLRNEMARTTAAQMQPIQLQLDDCIPYW